MACAKDVDGHTDLYLTDLQARTADAVEQLLTLLADHRSTVRHVSWSSGEVDPVLMRFPDKAVELKVRRQWMLRILDVPQALRRRGYTVGIEAELHLEVARGRRYRRQQRTLRGAGAGWSGPGGAGRARGPEGVPSCPGASLQRLPHLLGLAGRGTAGSRPRPCPSLPPSSAPAATPAVLGHVLGPLEGDGASGPAFEEPGPLAPLMQPSVS